MPLKRMLLMNGKPMLSVERELLAKLIEEGRISEISDAEWKELRALLDEPDEPFNLQGWSIDHSAGRPILMHNKCSVIEAEQAYGFLNLIETAAQHQGDPVVGHCTHPPGCKFCSWCGFKAEQPATVADHPQCEECKGWGYHENHYEGGGAECGECGGSGNAPVALVMPERYSLAMYQMISGFESVTPEQFDLVWSACRSEVARLNGVKP